METFAPVARLKSIRILLSIACHLGFKLYQMDVKSAFLNGVLQEEVYEEQPKGFQNPHHPHHVYKLKKALYGLKQDSRAWYEHLIVVQIIILASARIVCNIVLCKCEVNPTRNCVAKINLYSN
jgi:hypothetical protein